MSQDVANDILNQLTSAATVNIGLINTIKRSHTVRKRNILALMLITLLLHTSSVLALSVIFANCTQSMKYYIWGNHSHGGVEGMFAWEIKPVGKNNEALRFENRLGTYGSLATSEVRLKAAGKPGSIPVLAICPMKKSEGKVYSTPLYTFEHTKTAIPLKSRLTKVVCDSLCPSIEVKQGNIMIPKPKAAWGRAIVDLSAFHSGF